MVHLRQPGVPPPCCPHTVRRPPLRFRRPGGKHAAAMLYRKQGSVNSDSRHLSATPNRPGAPKAANILGVERVLVVVLVVLVAAAIAVFAQRRRPAPPTQSRWSAPAQLDRDDFDRPATPWLVAVFTSATCDSCASARDKAAVLASDDVVVHEVEVAARKDLHDRYQIEVVPMILLADAEGVVRKSFLGPPSATDLWAAVAEAHQGGDAPEPGTSPPGPA